MKVNFASVYRFFWCYSVAYIVDHGKHPKSVYAVYGQSVWTPNWYDFQNCVKQNFQDIISIWNKIKTFLISISCFIALWNKEIMLPHPVPFENPCYKVSLVKYLLIIAFSASISRHLMWQEPKCSKCRNFMECEYLKSKVILANILHFSLIFTKKLLSKRV